MSSVVEYNNYSDFISGDGKRIAEATFQRPVDANHVKDIVTALKEAKGEYTIAILGMIEMVEYNHTLYITDGQHRLRALKNLFELENKPIQFKVHIIPVSTSEGAANVFHIRNKNEDIPNFIKQPDVDLVSLKKEFYAYLIKKYMGMFRTKTTKRPYINIDTFFEKLEQSKILCNIRDIKHFISVFNFINEDCRQVMDKLSSTKKNTIGLSDSMIQKYKEQQLFVGYDNFKYFNKDLSHYCK